MRSLRVSPFNVPTWLSACASACAAGLLGITPTQMEAQSPPSATASRPAIRPLGTTVATSKESFGPVINNIRALPGGRVLVNDMVNRRVVLLDSTLSIVKVVADTTAATANAYGSSIGSLIPFRGDSTLFVDAQSLSMLVIAPSGEVARVMSVPRSQDAATLAGTNSAFYSNGHLVYRGRPALQFRQTGGSGTAPQMPAIPDTMPVIRVNLQTRAVDTVAYMKVPNTRTTMNRTEDGKMQPSIEINPLPVVDEWAVTSNGDIAILRGRDYHVDWVSADGARRASNKIAFDWKRMTDEDKTKLIDSVKAIRERQAAANPGQGQDLARAFGSAMGGGAAGGAGGGGGAPQVVMRFEMRDGGGAPGGPVRAPQIIAPQFTYVSPSDLPDYQPAFFANSLRADADGNLWVLTIPTKPQPAGGVYDVINPQGDAIERVHIPEGRTIVGFGPGGLVYLLARTTDGVTLETARIK
ncbi:MAG: hypothetical protein IBJ03_08725 [Gemmatimonadaceae bacterium]|nr:hypothetical protein [Gemmatimonadaceae bacterium]